MLQPVQRTLIISLGPLARQAGLQSYEQLVARDGPVGVVALVEADGPAAALDEALEEALRQISLTTQSVALQAGGYLVDSHPEIAIYFLAGLCPGCGQRIVALTQAIRQKTAAYLGADCYLMLLWLALDPQPDLVTANLAQLRPGRSGFLQGVWLMSLTNENGLRLPDKQALLGRCADLLWLLIATPLRRLPDWLTLGQAEPLLVAPGVYGWEWDPGTVTELLAQRWQLTVINLWLAPAGSCVTPAYLDHWLAEAGLSLPQLAATLQSAWPPGEPSAPDNQWVAPAPWSIRAQLATAARADRADIARQEQSGRDMARQFDYLLQTAGKLLSEKVTERLDRQPVGSVAWTSQFLAELAEEFALNRRELLNELEQAARQDQRLSGQMVALEEQVSRQLDSWPNPSLSAWIRPALALWCWPAILWRYRRLRLQGQQLSLLYRQRAGRRLAQSRQLLTAHLLQSLRQQALELAGRVDEVGDMLGYLQSRVAAWPGPATAGSELNRLVNELFTRYVPEPEASAAAAVLAVGGLSSQLRQPDDEPLLAQLESWVIAQLETVSQIPAHTIAALRQGEQEQLGFWWTTAWAEAASLWRDDPAQLLGRLQGKTNVQLFVAGSNLTELLVRPQAPPGELKIVETADRRRLFFLTVRAVPFLPQTPREARE